MTKQTNLAGSDHKRAKQLDNFDNRVIGTSEHRCIGAVINELRPALRFSFWLMALLISVWTHAQTATVTASVEVTNAHAHHKKINYAGVVLWLTPTAGGESAAAAPASFAKPRFTLLQKNKMFEPHILVVPVGSEVDFPNKDPFFHNVFSLFEGKRFDLGLYEAGSTRSLRFDRPGISYLFCNIHPEMSAVIIALETPYYAVSNAAGQVVIPHVPDGAYTLHVWREGSAMEALKSLSRTVVVSGNSSSLEKLRVPDNGSLPLAHKNKYGRDYEEPTPPGQVYSRP